MSHIRKRATPLLLALGLVVVFVMFARVYVGAHNPLDVICGAALGVAIGAAINLALSAPRPVLMRNAPCFIIAICSRPMT